MGSFAWELRGPNSRGGGRRRAVSGLEKARGLSCLSFPQAVLLNRKTQMNSMKKAKRTTHTRTSESDRAVGGSELVQRGERGSGYSETFNFLLAKAQVAHAAERQPD